MKWNKLKLANRDCRGIYLWWDFTGSEITSENAKELKINNDYKLQIRLKINGRIAKKTFTFNKFKTLIGAIAVVNSKRLELIETYKTTGTLKPEKQKAIISIDHLWNTFIEEIQSTTRKDNRKPTRASTIETYQSTYRTHIKGAVRLNHAVEDTNKLIKKLEDNDYQPAYIHNLILPFKQMLREHVDINGIILPKIENQRKYDYSAEQTSKLVESMENFEPIAISDKLQITPEIIKGIFAFLLEGRRINEILTLEKKDINLETMTYTIRKENSKIDTELTFNISEYLLPFIPKRRGILFPTTKITARKWFYRMLDEAKLPRIHMHDVRHAVATVSLNNQASIADVSRMLGHKSIITTENRYVNKTPEMASRAVSAFRESIKKKDT